MTDPDFRNAFYAYKDVLYRFVYRMTGSANGAEDIVQECFLALWRKPDAYDPGRGALRPFLLGIARNLVLKRWRDEHPHDSLEEDAFMFTEGNDRYDIKSTSGIVPAGGRFNLYVLHLWRPTGDEANSPIIVGAADRAEGLVGK